MTTAPAGAVDAPACPVCAASTIAMPVPSRAGMITAIETALAAGGLEAVMPPQYGLRRCAACTLEFAHPMREPGAGFYQWLTQAGFAYHAARREWDACRARIESMPRPAGRPLQVLDVGCGDGGFLRQIVELPDVVAFGVEFNPDVVAAARARGLDVRLGGLSEATRALPAGADVITFWHVVEHSGDPVGLLAQAREALRPGGRLCFSVPLSPLSYEHAWFDPFNAPPHHLTRWNLVSLQALAERLGLSMQLELPNAASLAHRVLRSLVLQAMPMTTRGGRWVKALRLAGFLLGHPWRIFSEVAGQLRRPDCEGRALPDLVMVCLQRPASSSGSARDG